MLVPPVPKAPELPFAIAAMLPNRDHNRALLDFLDARPNLSGQRVVTAAVFAADPFLHRPSLAKSLRNAGVSGVANFPPSHHLGEGFDAGLDEVGLGFERDLDLLRWLKSEGFQTACFAATPSQAVAAAGQETDRIVLLPRLTESPDTFDEHGRPTARYERLAADVGEALSGAADGREISIFAYHEGASEPDMTAASIGFDGIVIVPI